MKKKALFLSLLMLASSFASCGESTTETTPQSGETKSAVETQPVETEIPDDLPDMDYAGAEFRIYTRECCLNHKNGVYMPEQVGDVVSDAVYNRNLTVEERFNVHIAEPILAPDAEATALNASVQAGDDMCEVAIWHYKHLGDSAAAGYLADISQAGYIGFEKPWWYQKVNDAYSIADHAYLIVGMYDLDNYLDNICLYFNKNMIIDLTGDDDLYSVVKEGGWTLDRMKEIAALAGVDTNGDGTMDMLTDNFGYGMPSGFGFVYQFAWEQPVTIRNSEGYPEDASNTERMVTMVETLRNFLFDNDYIINDEAGTSGTAFKENRLLFCVSNLNAASSDFRDMDQDFGILPVPKLEETQKEYYTHATAHTSAVGIPVVKDKAGLEFSSLILEAMAAEGYKQIRPAVYDVALKSKYTRDEASFEMIDIVVQGRTADFAEIYDKWGLTYTLDQVARGGVKEWASHYAANSAKQQQNINDVVEMFKALEGK